MQQGRSSASLPIRERVRFALRHMPPTEALIDLVMARMPANVVLPKTRSAPESRVPPSLLDARQMGVLVRTLVAEMGAEGIEY